MVIQWFLSDISRENKLLIKGGFEMKAKTVSLIMLLCLIISFPASAITARDISDYSDVPMALAWREGDTIYVAIVNEYSSRQGYTIEVYDTQRRAALERRDIIVPGNSILIEALKPRITGGARFPIEEVTIYSGYRGRTIKIQENELFTVKDYVVPSNTVIDIDVDLLGIRGYETRGRIIVDNEYMLSNTSRGGQITVKYDPGFSYTHRNIIEYRAPFLTITMRTPYFRDVGILSFGITNSPVGSWRSEYIYGPVFLVYGSDYRLIDNTTGQGKQDTGTDTSSGWVTR